MPKRILRLPALMDKVGLGRSSIYAMMAEGTFPTPIKLGERAVGWVEEEIDAWLEARIAERKEPDVAA